MTPTRFLTGVGVLMFVAGIIAGPGYYLYCTQFSGKQVGKFPVSGRANTWSLPGGVTLAFGGAGAFKPFSIDLDPQMNPVIFNWHGSVSGMVMTNRERDNGYKASLYLGRQTLMVETFSISRDEKEQGTVWKGGSIGSFDVPQAGQYHFVLEEVTQPRISVSGIQIEVRRNVIVPSIPVVFTGYALFVAGILFTIVMLSWNQSTLSAAERRALASLSSYKPPLNVRIFETVFVVGFIMVCGLFLILWLYIK